MRLLNLCILGTSHIIKNASMHNMFFANIKYKINIVLNSHCTVMEGISMILQIISNKIRT